MTLPQLPIDPFLAFSSKFGIAPNGTQLFPSLLDPLGIKQDTGSCPPIVRKDGTPGIENGLVQYSRTPYLKYTVATLQCFTGNAFINETSSLPYIISECAVDNKGFLNWYFPSGKQPECGVVQCDDISASVSAGGGQVSYSFNRLVNSLASINCNQGSSFNGESADVSIIQLQCLPDPESGNVAWSTPSGDPLPNPVCLWQSCPNIVLPPGSEVDYSGITNNGLPVVGTTALITCTQDEDITFQANCFLNQQGSPQWSDISTFACN